MVDDSQERLSNAILKTVAYSDVFDHPLRAREIHRYLIGWRISFDEFEGILENQKVVVRSGEFYFLPGREAIIEIRAQRESRSRRLMPRALQIGRILGALPFVRMVALTGSLAVMNVSKNEDFDYMLVTVPGRLWTARAFTLLLNRITKGFGHTICPNLILSEQSLEWPLHDIYSARELCQMVPIAGTDVYRKLIRLNAWATDILPNAFMATNSMLFNGVTGISPSNKWTSTLQKSFEHLLGGRLGERFEEWEMKRKIRRFSRQQGFGEETVFNKDVCQGNFDHHRKWTREVYEKKLSALDSIDGTDMLIHDSSVAATGGFSV